MFGDLLSGLVNKEQMAGDAIKETLISLSEELGLPHTELFVMIRPIDTEFNPQFWVYKVEGGKPIPVREITLKEILESS